jgi:hypothetical protein
MIKLFIYSIMAKRKSKKLGKNRKGRKTLKGGCSTIGAAVLPFGLLGLQKYFQSDKNDVPSYYRKESGYRRHRRRRSSKNKSD